VGRQFFVELQDLPDIARPETAQHVITGGFLSLLWNPPVAEFTLKMVEPVTLEVFSDYV
jgi:hypothetical protein